MKCDAIANQPDRRCPGNFKLNCTDDDVGSGFNPEDDCDVGHISYQGEEIIQNICKHLSVLSKWRICYE